MLCLSGWAIGVQEVKNPDSQSVSDFFLFQSLRTPKLSKTTATFVKNCQMQRLRSSMIEFSSQFYFYFFKSYFYFHSIQIYFSSTSIFFSILSDSNEGTQCSNGALAVVMKNWEPLVLGPPFAMAMRPLFVNFIRKFCQALRGHMAQQWQSTR